LIVADAAPIDAADDECGIMQSPASAADAPIRNVLNKTGSFEKSTQDYIWSSEPTLKAWKGPGGGARRQAAG
jgi:hypothetical protein